MEVAHVTSEEHEDEPTLNELENEASIAAWNKVRGSILSAITECQAMPVDQKCQCENTALLRCVTCGPNAYFCEKYFLDDHKFRNTFHLAKMWEVSTLTVLFYPIS